MSKLKLKNLQVLYLHGDGHAVAKYETRDKRGVYTDWVELHESLGIRVAMKGRLIIGPGLAAALKHITHLRAREASVEAGSTNSQRLGIAVSTLHLRFAGAFTDVTWSSFPGVIHDDWTYQHDAVETWAEVAERYHWEHFQIGAKFPVEREAVSA